MALIEYELKFAEVSFNHCIIWFRITLSTKHGSPSATELFIDIFPLDWGVYIYNNKSLLYYLYEVHKINAQ
jgi:hypothetical protein